MKLIGNSDILGQINIAIKSARDQNRPIPHMLLSGAAGCGKTSTSKYVAEIAGSDLLTISADSVKKREDVLSIIDRLNHNGYDKHGRKVSTIRPTIVFIDEVHNVPLTGQEHMGIAMEEWYLPVTKKESKVEAKNLSARGNVIRWSPEFTIIGATTNDGKLSKPFRDRFKLRFLFRPYPLVESSQIVRIHAERLNIKLDDYAALEIAQRGRGVPRILVSFLERCRDTAVALGKYQSDKTGEPYDIQVTQEISLVTFEQLKIDKTGLTTTDVTILKTLYDVGEPIGLDNLAVVLNENTSVLSEAVEPYLIQRGFIVRTGKGRKITEKGTKYLMENGYIKFELEQKFDIPRDFDRGL